MSDNILPTNPEINFMPPTAEEAAYAMFTGIQANLVSFAKGEREEFSAVFASGYDSWMNSPEGSSERIHGLALEKFYAANESRIIEGNGQRCITMTIVDGEQAYERILSMNEFVDDYGKVYQIIIYS